MRALISSTHGIEHFRRKNLPYDYEFAVGRGNRHSDSDFRKLTVRTRKTFYRNQGDRGAI